VPLPQARAVHAALHSRPAHGSDVSSHQAAETLQHSACSVGAELQRWLEERACWDPSVRRAFQERHFNCLEALWAATEEELVGMDLPPHVAKEVLLPLSARAAVSVNVSHVCICHVCIYW
jgi:hypothetical protein